MPNKRTTRAKVPVGAIFGINVGDGRLGQKRYGAIGQNGKFASINMANGNLAFTSVSGASKKVIVVGSYDIKANLLPPSQHNKMARARVTDAMLFTIAEGNNVYAHLGKNRDGDCVSLNLRSRDYAVGAGRGNVTVVGSYKLQGQTAA